MVTVVKAPAPPAGPELEPSEIAGLDALEAQAGALEGSAGSGMPGQAPAPAANSTNAAEVRAAFDGLYVLAAPAFRDWPEYSIAWGEETRAKGSEAIGAILDMHGWSMPEILGKWAPYIAVVGALAMPTIATLQHLKERKARQLAEQRANLRQPQQGQPLPPEEAEGVRP